ncbi:MAG: GNAT family N-acetyltransferase [Solirubrobacteraceae bacterium]
MLRPATADDVPAAWALTRAAFEQYHSFGIEGYTPPEESVEDFGARLGACGAWGVVAEAADEVAGIGAFEPAREQAKSGPLVKGLAHVFAIFVAEPHWGDGTATALLDAVVAEIRSRGYAEARLFTPAAQTRARRFYAREGWSERGAPVPVAELGLDMIELRRPI